TPCSISVRRSAMSVPSGATTIAVAVMAAPCGKVMESFSSASCEEDPGISKVLLNFGPSATAVPPSTTSRAIQTPITLSRLRKHQRPRAYSCADMSHLRKASSGGAGSVHQRSGFYVDTVPYPNDSPAGAQPGPDGPRPRPAPMAGRGRYLGTAGRYRRWRFPGAAPGKLVAMTILL